MVPLPPAAPRAPRRDGPRLVGRAAELVGASERLDRLVAGAGSAWTYVGEAGAGKSALLDAIVARAEALGVVPVRVVGVEGEGTIAWGAVADACEPFVGLIDRVGAARGRALRSALALGDDVSPVDALAVALGLLELLAEAAAEHGAPVLLVVDDLPWIDAESRSALSFVARRLGDDPVGIVAGARSATATVGDRVDLGPLDATDVRHLVAAAGVRARPAQDAIAEASGGRPLLALQLAASLTPAERSGARPVPTPLRLPDDVRDLYRPAIDRLADATRVALLVVAADRSGEVEVVAGALDALGGSIDDLAEAESAGLVEVAGDAVACPHPLVRSAAYHGADAPTRRAVHRALAAAAGPTSAAGVLHRAAAVVGRDDAVGDALAELAATAVGHGAPLTGASRFVRAASAATQPGVRAGRLVMAARAALAGGDGTWAEQLLRQAGAVDAARVQRADAQLVEARCAIVGGRLDDARTVAELAASTHGADDPIGAAEVLVEVARPLLVDDPVGVGPMIERAGELAADDAGRVGLRAQILVGCHRGVFAPSPEAERQVGRWVELLALEGPVLAGPFLADTVALYLGYTGRRAEALALLDRLERPIRASGVTGALIEVLSARSFVAYGSDLRSCVLAGREALELSEETGQPGLSSVALDTLVIAAANAGDAELTHQVAQRQLASGSLRGELWARAALGRLHLVEERPDLAVEQFARLRRRVGADNPSFTQFESDEAEALIRVGRVDDARALVPALARDAAARGGWSTAQHERILALLADDIDEAAGHFEAARESLVDGGNRIAQGIVELAWGEWLRRAKRRAEARRHLLAAIERFDLVGAMGLRHRAEAELTAAGGAVDRARPTDELLAPIELQVARLAVAGQTNRTIAGELFLSPRTVENHLGAVYRKLGVAGRPGLLARAATDPLLAPATGSGGA